MSCNRFVVIGMTTTERAGLTGDPSPDGQGQGDPGKGGLGPSTSPPPFERGIAMVQGVRPAHDMGAIEFPTADCAWCWLFDSAAGKAFLARYDTVFVQATFGCSAA